MLFNYKALDMDGTTKEGAIEAVTMDVAISSLQKRGYVISSIKPEEEKGFSLTSNITFLNRVKTKDIVILSRQIATLFTAQVSALRVFRLLASEAGSPILRKSINQVADDIQGGSSISQALAQQPEVFSDFYVNMVRAGEESGKLDQQFMFLADYLERSYEVTSKAKNALIYPAFVITTFFGVMILMFTVVIPKISTILTDAGQDIPIYTKIVLAISNFFVNYWAFLGGAVVLGGFLIFRYIRTDSGKSALSVFKLDIPYVGDLYKKLYLSRIADNMNTMILSGISMIRALEITSEVVGNDVYKTILQNSLEAVRGGSSVSASLAQEKERIPGIMIQMIKVGEETGELGNILKTLSKFYQREVMTAVDTLVDLIEPVMIVVLGLGVGILLASVLIPIYNIAGAF